MSAFPRSPRILKAGLVLLDPESARIEGVIAMQYNPDSLTRSLQVRDVELGDANHAEAMRLTGPPIETLRFSAEIDATDQLEFPRENPDAVDTGIQPQLSALEMIVYPTSENLIAVRDAAEAGTLEIAPAESPLLLFVWSKSRVLPVRISSFSITEESFDVNLNPIRAKVDLELRVLSVNDLGFDHRGGSLFLAYQQQKERLAQKARRGEMQDLGIEGLL